MRKSFVFIFVLSILIHSCGSKSSDLGIRLPKGDSITWYFDVYKYNEDTLKIGTASSRIVETGTFEDRDDVTEFERRIRLDSMQNTTRPVDVRSSYLQIKNNQVNLFAESYFDIFDGMLSNIVLDTLSRNRDGEEFQQFSFIEPGWLFYLNLENDAEVPTTVHPSYTVYLDFYNRDIHLTGSVSLYAETRFNDFDFLETDLQARVLTFKYQTTVYMDFTLQKDGVDIPTFRTTFNYYQWVHKTSGILQKERTPIQIYIPQVPSRYPIVFIPGELWKLSAIDGLSL
ncbi:hypothetical protein EP331_14200 [bacterium]|nr:MAG: hypothetical protein EP331_14200 [bacterium]